LHTTGITGGLSMGASKPATHGRFKTSQGFWGSVSYRISM
jgi:hypothetical protein